MCSAVFVFLCEGRGEFVQPAGPRYLLLASSTSRFLLTPAGCSLFFNPQIPTRFYPMLDRLVLQHFSPYSLRPSIAALSVEGGECHDPNISQIIMLFLSLFPIHYSFQISLFSLLSIIIRFPQNTLVTLGSKDLFVPLWSRLRACILCRILGHGIFDFSFEIPLIY